jgi:uncharacterized NAD-dependent epimerase/dehydratase family protein
MVDSAAIRDLLLGSGGFIATSMTGIGAYRFFASGAKKIAQIPMALTSGAEELSKLRVAVENDNSMKALVIEQGAVLKDIREDIGKMMGERQEIGRELRIISRKVEGLSIYGQDQD